MKYRIGDICEIINGQTPRTDNPVYWDGDIPWITPKDLSLNKGKFISRGERNITEAGFDSCSTTMVPAGTVLLTSRAPIGYLAIANNPLCTNQGFKSLIPNESIVTNQFLYYWLQTKVGYLQGIAGGSTFKELSKPQLSEVEIDLPEMTVQRHIVDAIGSVDDLIEKYDEELHLLDQEAHFQFCRFINEHNTEIALLSSIAKIDGGYAYTGFELRPSRTGMVTIKSFGRGGNFQQEGIKGLIPTKDKAFQLRRLSIGDILVAHTDLTKNCDIVGNAVMVQDFYGYSSLTFSMDLERVVSSSKAYSQRLLLEYLNNSFKPWALQHCSGTTVVHLSKDALMTFQIPKLASDIDAASLSSLLDTFTSLERITIQKKAQAKALKAMLMNKYFGSIS